MRGGRVCDCGGKVDAETLSGSGAFDLRIDDQSSPHMVHRRTPRIVGWLIDH